MVVERKKPHEASHSQKIITEPQDKKTLKALASIIARTTEESSKVLKNVEGAKKIIKRHISGQTFDENQHSVEPRMKVVSQTLHKLQKGESARSLHAHHVAPAA